ncbi:uncharacterized protein PHALS_03863 [Plasmopara halstedii]|uniref:Uncharacterized protein n=1 Tax=Plasmopara halstedii TaxID=4781 RepID=A0A0P1AXQ6_PLAHL|nr:uncharacterized protein PHALS_03863 [Plasmopara halstedii]CEG47215.1 hypothetical protein PHALS_03863 [Plasmopara halstedii]|eukprot:XP_024583584.1 hypothetical protein PHALS_03863 [Plasmopara halstedii]
MLHSLTASSERRSVKSSHQENLCYGYKPIEWQSLVLDAIDMLLNGGRRK